MAFMQWQDSFSVGVASMDAQHKQLVEMVNQLYDAMRISKGDQVIKTLLPNLLSYTRVHFNAEEKLMHEAGFPGIAAHQALHHKLAQQVSDLVERFQSGKLVATVSLGSFLKDWLTNHILGEDVNYGKYIQSKQLTGAAR